MVTDLIVVSGPRWVKRASREWRCFTRGRACAVERVTRIELAFSAWEADVLPLNYTREERPIVAGPSSGHTRGVIDELLDRIAAFRRSRPTVPELPMVAEVLDVLDAVRSPGEIPPAPLRLRPMPCLSSDDRHRREVEAMVTLRSG